MNQHFEITIINTLLIHEYFSLVHKVITERIKNIEIFSEINDIGFVW